MKSGESRSVSFSLPIEELAFWNIDMKKVVEAGDFNLWVGGDSRAALKGSFVVE
ncbi:fibronectin type III-like domain-contianing protein [Macellibacteroides fermentans]